MLKEKITVSEKHYLSHFQHSSDKPTDKAMTSKEPFSFFCYSEAHGYDEETTNQFKSCLNFIFSSSVANWLHHFPSDLELWIYLREWKLGQS